MSSSAKYLGRVRRNLVKRVSRTVKTENGERNYVETVPDGHEVGEVRVTVDMDSILQVYGPGALKNKSGKSKYMHGAVLIEVVARSKVSE